MIGNIKLNTKTLDNLSKINFESYLDGVGKPLDGLANKIGGLDKYASKLFGGIDKFSKVTSQILSKESKFKNFVAKMEKTMNSIGKAIGGFVGSVKNFVGNLIKAGISSLKKITGAILNALQIGKLATALKNCFNAILSVIKKPLEFVSKLIKKALRFVKNFLGVLGVSLKLKKAFKKELTTGNIPNSLNNALNKLLSKSIILSTLTGIKHHNDEDLYKTSKAFISSSGYNSVMSSYRTIFNKSLYYKDDDNGRGFQEQNSQMYRRVYDRILNEYNNEEDEEIMLSKAYNKVNYKSLAKHYDFGDEGRGWMNYDIKSLSKVSDSDLKYVYNNESIKKLYPYKPIISYSKVDDYEAFKNKDINQFEKILAMSNFNRDGFYIKDNNLENQYKNYSISKFEGFNKGYKLKEKEEIKIVEKKKDRVTGF